MAGPASADYEYGFSWQRQSDWVPGDNDGGVGNNPGPDPLGAPVWSYQYTTGGGLDSANPWYAEPRTMLVWDSQWHGSDDGVWARDDDQSPPVYDTAVIHHNKAGQNDFIPIVGWANPVGEAIEVNIGGSFLLEWEAGNGLAYPNDVDFVIALLDASEGTVTPLFSQSFSKPTDGITGTESIEFDVSLENVALGVDDELLISHRADTEIPFGWVTLNDNFDIVLVPAPGAASLVAIAGLGMIRRRR
jgi:hypothetical protein